MMRLCIIPLLSAQLQTEFKVLVKTCRRQATIIGSQLSELISLWLCDSLESAHGSWILKDAGVNKHDTEQAMWFWGCLTLYFIVIHIICPTVQNRPLDREDGKIMQINKDETFDYIKAIDIRNIKARYKNIWLH